MTDIKNNINNDERAEILCVGTELLLGDIVNTNAAFLAKELASLGISVYHQSVIGDHPDRLKAVLEQAFVLQAILFSQLRSFPYQASPDKLP